MLAVRKKRILNEDDGIRTFLLRFGRLKPCALNRALIAAQGCGENQRRQECLYYGGFTCQCFIGRSSAPAGVTSPSAAGNGAPDGSGRKIRSRLRFLTAEAGSHEAYAPLVPAAGPEGSCEAASPPIGGMPLRNDEWKILPSQPAPPARFSGPDGIRCIRRFAG